MKTRCVSDPDLIDYWVGHKVDTYHDIRSLGIEKQRSVYAAAGLRIRSKTNINKMEAIKEMLRACGANSEEILTKGRPSRRRDHAPQSEKTETLIIHRYYTQN